MDAQKIYRNALLVLQKRFSKNQPIEEIWKAFMNEISTKLKMQITFDARFSESLRSYYNQTYQNFMGTELMPKILKWIVSINNFAYFKKFILKRDYEKLNATMENILNSPASSWLQALQYVHASQTLLQFREDFLYRICKLNQDQIGIIFQDIENNDSLDKLKAEYTKFFKKCLDPNIPVKIANYVQMEWSQWENKSEMLPLDLLQSLERRLGAEVGRNKNQIEINNLLVTIAQENSYQNAIETQQRLENEIKLIQKALQKFSGLNIIKQKNLVLRLGKFGSLISGFAGLDADLDLTILTSCYVNENQFLKIVFEFLKKQYQEGDRRSSGRRAIPELIITAKTPLISITISERGEKDIKIDIIINNILGVINSKFLKVYAGVRWVRNLGILVKLWGKLVDLIGKQNLSSYSMILMLIHYLIKQKKVNPIMDARARSNDSPHFKFKRIKQGVVQQFDVYYAFKTNSQDVSTTERVNYYKILLGFMKYYAIDIDKQNENGKIITVDLSCDRQIDVQTAITIKDPFDKPHNPGRMRIESLSFMKLKFKEAYEILKLKNVDRIRDLFSR